MGITLTGQAGLFMLSCLVGLALGVIYDLFRIARVAARCSAAAVFVQDIIFWLICAAVTFAFLVIANSGKPRAFILLGELCGAVIWYATLGGIAVRKIKAADQKIKRRVRTAASAAARPVIRLGNSVSQKIDGGRRKTYSYLKKESKMFKLRLKVHQKMMYNLLRATKRQKKRGVRNQGNN